jgi:hypothetical protein
MLDYDPIKNLQHYPISGGMRRFGLNVYGEPLFRVVFAPSRRYLVVGDYARWEVLHKHLGNVWIMERWLPAEQFAKCSKEEWERDNLVLGPWPSKGEYELCHVFDVAPPSDASIDTLITWIEYGRRIPFGETLQFQREDAKREKLATQAKAEDMIRNRLPAFGSNPFVGGRGHRGTKTAPLRRFAEELGMPTRPGLMASGKRTQNPVTRLINSSQPQQAA